MSTNTIYVRSAALTICGIAFLYFYSRPPSDAALRNVPSGWNQVSTNVQKMDFHEEEVRIDGDGVLLAGTLTLPSKPARACVLLVGGSGPNDRDEYFLGHRPFAVLAHFLANHGFAVLRYDKRGIEKSSGDFDVATVQDFASDAAAAFRFLHRRPEASELPCGALGHSEGALLAAMLAASAESNHVGFLVLMGMPGVKGEEFCLSQAASTGRALSLDLRCMESLTNCLKGVYAIMRSEADPESAKQAIAARLEQFRDVFEKSNANGKDQISDSIIWEQAKSLASPWTKSFIAMDPQSILSKVHCPTIVLQGEKDVQVPLSNNFTEIQRFVGAAGVTNFTLTVLANHNHMFQRATTGAPTEYGTIDEAISSETLSNINQWLVAQVRTPDQ